jgi:hypothetical protein
MWEPDSDGNPFEIGGVYDYMKEGWILEKLINNDLGLFRRCDRETFKQSSFTIDLLYTKSFKRIGTVGTNTNKEAARLLSKEW